MKDGANMPMRCQRVTSAAASTPCPAATTASGEAVMTKLITT